MKIKKKPYKKSQMHIGETAAILAVFFVIGLIAFVFYFKVIRSNIEYEKEETKGSLSVGIIQKALSLPELQCSEMNVIRNNCVDKIKLDIMKTKSQTGESSKLYFDLFGFSIIKITEVYPAATPPTPTRIIYSNEMSEGKFSSKKVANLPVIIYNPIANKNNFGYMTVETFSK